jgi:Ca2+-binding RTX toxin-like protein
VAIDWPIVVVGAPYDDDHATDGGAVHGFVFETSIGIPGGSWEHRLLPIDGGVADDADLGRSVGVQGATVVAGAPGDTGGGTDRGTVHVFRGGPATKGWTHEQALVDPDGENGNRLGRSVAVDGEWILAGAPGEAYEGTASGVAHAFAEVGAPNVYLESPADGARYPVHAVVAADYLCTDHGADIASCVGDVPNGAPIDTSTAGVHTFSVTAFDAVGNSTTVTHTYEVPECEGLPVTHIAEPGAPLDGTGGPDVMLGTPGDDVITGFGGDDTVCGLGGDDLLLGGPGDDTLVGGDGKDKLRGAAGDDDLRGGAGSDRLLPESGNDTVDGGPGSDIVDYLAARGPVDVDLVIGLATYTPGDDIWTHRLTRIEKADGSVYDDRLVGDDRRNVLRGKQGADRIWGNGGDDDLIGGTRGDRIYGGTGNDLVKGQADGDTLEGQGGNDKIVGGAGSDTLLGGAGDDLLIGGLRVHEGVYSNTIDGGAGNDTCRWDFDDPSNC